MIEPANSESDRRLFLRTCASGAAAAVFAGCTEPSGREASGVAAGAATPAAKEGESKVARDPAARMPVVFVGHGSPMNAIEDNEWSRAFAALGRALPKPKAVLDSNTVVRLPLRL